MPKISARLQLLMGTPPERVRALADQQHYAIDMAGDVPRFTVTVKYDGDTDKLTAAGLVLRSPPHGGFATGSATAEVIRRLEALESVEMIIAPHPVDPELNVAVPAIAADRTQRSGVGGANVLVGVIDVGINWRHPDFCNPDGTTRILAIWDQSLTAQPGESPPANFPYGVEYTSSQINAALLTDNPPVPIRATNSSHGTHVTGIAAGNGQASPQMVPAGNYSGVAPESRIIFVRAGRLGVAFEYDVIAAIKYLAEKSSALGRPIAINMSFGKKLGPHDGQSLYEREIDAILGQGIPGLVLVKSAGNEGEAARHVSATVDTRVSQIIPVELALNDSHVEIEFWYPLTDRVSVTVTDQDATERLTVTPGNTDTKTFPSGDRLTIISTIREPESNENLITIIISRLAAQPLATWTISLDATTLLPVKVDGYLRGGANYDTHFLGPTVTSASTITEPGNAQRIITVGAYITKTTGYGIGIGDLANFSSRGPTRDGRLKPDVAAPGKITYSANDAYPPAIPATVPPYVGMSGTSMAAPLVTGTAALILTVARGTLQATARSFLRETARSDVHTGETPNNSWGYGKVDTFDAVAAAHERVPLEGSPAVHAPSAPNSRPMLSSVRQARVPATSAFFPPVT